MQYRDSLASEAKAPLPALNVKEAQRLRSTARGLMQAIEQLGHSATMLRLGFLLQVAAHPGAQAVELAAMLGVSQASASRYADDLERRGLVTTHRDRSSRQHWVSDEGEALIRAVLGVRRRARRRQSMKRRQA